jgi:hypothetical protein
MSSLRLALKLSMVEAPAGSVQSKSEENEETYNALEKQAQKRKRKMSAGGGDDQQTSSADTGDMAFNLMWIWITIQFIRLLLQNKYPKNASDYTMWYNPSFKPCVSAINFFLSTISIYPLHIINYSALF